MKPAIISRSYSDKYLPGKSDYDLFKNRNIDWLRGPFFKVFYITITLFSWVLVYSSGLFAWEDSWTTINMAHGVITFIIFHWIKGCPDDSNQGEYNALTLFEQIDAGTPWTITKKFLMLVPTLLTWMSCYAADYKPFYLIINLSIFFICLIAKMPQMHGVRILGINSTPGIDNPILIDETYKKKK